MLPLIDVNDRFLQMQEEMNKMKQLNANLLKQHQMHQRSAEAQRQQQQQLVAAAGMVVPAVKRAPLATLPSKPVPSTNLAQPAPIKKKKPSKKRKKTAVQLTAKATKKSNVSTPNSTTPTPEVVVGKRFGICFLKSDCVDLCDRATPRCAFYIGQVKEVKESGEITMHYGYKGESYPETIVRVNNLRKMTPQEEKIDDALVKAYEDKEMNKSASLIIQNQNVERVNYCLGAGQTKKAMRTLTTVRFRLRYRCNCASEQTLFLTHFPVLLFVFAVLVFFPHFPILLFLFSSLVRS